MTHAGADGARRDVARELAEWLERLGLAGALADAGLPTYVRTERGVFWSMPSTGEPLTEGELAELEAALRGEGDDPAHAVPVSLVQQARTARERARLLASPVLDHAGLARLRATSENAARFWVHKAASDDRVLLLQVEGRTVIPAFQFDATGEVRVELADVLETLLRSGRDRWQVWSWLTGPAALLSGDVPEALVDDPEGRSLVQHAARRLAARVTERT